MSIELLHEIHSSISRDTLENPEDLGAFRKTDSITVVDERDNEVMHVPPKAADLPGRIDRMIEFANEENQEGRPFIHPLARAALLHFWLAYEHPYVDGNGRTARALFYWKMLRGGYNLFRYLTLSRIINDARMKYYRAFMNSERDDNDLTYFILHQFDVTRQAIDQLRENVERKLAEKRELERTLSVPGLNARQLAIIHRAIKYPKQIFTFQSHRESHGISLQTARTDILELAERGFLVDRHMKYPRQFVPASDILSHMDPRA
jgi:Fic family protein